MAPHRNHVEARSSRELARQFVSETHDHKPDAPEATAPDFYVGLPLVTDEIELGLKVLTAKVRALRSAQAAKQAVAMKLAAEDVAKVSNQINMLATQTIRTTLRHINRRSRV
jgi:hypothetical protein